MLPSGCARQVAPKKVVYPGQVTPEMRVHFNEVEGYYRRRHYDDAFLGYQHFIETYPHTRLTDEAIYKQGKIFFLKQQYADAVRKFEALFQKSPSPVYRAKARHMAGYAFFRMERYDQALSQFKTMEPDALPPKLRAQNYSLIIEASRMSHRESDFADYAKLRLLSLYEDVAGEELKNLRAPNVISYPDARLLVETWLDKPMGKNEIPGWLEDFPDSSARAYVDFKLARIAYDAGDKRRAQRLFTRFVRRYPKNPYVAIADSYLKELGGPGVAVGLKKAHYKLGVLLPLQGRYESYSRTLLDGIRCGVGEGGVCGGFSGIELVVKDTGFTPASVRQAVADLADQKVVAIIGPLAGLMATEAGVTATAKKIPIFPITQKSELMRVGDYVFQVGMQPRQQIKALAQAALDRGYRTFGVFYPDNNYGETMATLFVNQIKSQGGRITAMAAYNKRSPDPFAEARKLKRSIGRVGAPGRGVGFDALFIPDSYQTVNNLVSALEFNGIKDIPLLGTNAWNDPGLTLAIAKKFPGSFFVDVYDGAANTKEVREFKERFIKSFGRVPRVLEAYGYDIVMMIRKAAQEEGPHDIKKALTNERSFRGVTGIKGFEIGQGAVIESMVLKITETGVGE